LKYYLLYIFVLFTVSITAQQDSLKVNYDNRMITLKRFDADNLEKYRTDKEFNYEIKKRQTTFLEHFFNWLKRILYNFLSWLFGNEKAAGILAVIVKIVPYVIAAIVLFLLLKFFLKVNMRHIISGKTNKSTVQLTEDEELIKNQDLSELIQQAVEQKNYRLAVRYYYLFALQKLSNHHIIDWQQQKTNEDYIKEIESHIIKQKFSSSTYLYDFVWYGNFEINELEFAKAETQFNELNKLIS